MAAKKPELDETTLRIAQRILSTPPKPHSEMKLGKDKAESSKNLVGEHKLRQASKGRVHKGKTRD